jgi:pyruvate formate lyase activating enzyme
VNADGRLRLRLSPRGVIAQIEPIEKKPFYHFLPGSQCYSVGASGCNMKCPYCINWELSQPMDAGDSVSPGRSLSPAEVVAQAQAAGCASIAYTYTEPAVFFEYILATAQLAKVAGLANVFKTNGFIMAEPLTALTPYLDAANVDLKSFSDHTYRKLGGQLQPVLSTLRQLRAAGVWIEVATLVVPGQNDSEDELKSMARFIADEVGAGTPWHILRFFPSYKMSDVCPTAMATLERALEIGRTAGLSFTYLSNLSALGNQDTNCPMCGNVAIVRTGRGISNNKIELGRCGVCHTDIPGLWASRWSTTTLTAPAPECMRA